MAVRGLRIVGKMLLNLPTRVIAREAGYMPRPGCVTSELIWRISGTAILVK
jgi:hypothetical protein